MKDTSIKKRILHIKDFTRVEQKDGKKLSKHTHTREKIFCNVVHPDRFHINVETGDRETNKPPINKHMMD
jgi:hypothetical protein